MKITYAWGLDPKAVHAKIAGIHTSSIASVEDYIFRALTKRLFHLPKKYWAGASVTYVSAGVNTNAWQAYHAEEAALLARPADDA